MSQFSRRFVKSTAGKRVLRKRHRHFRWRFSLILFLSALIFWSGYRKRPTVAAEGTSFYGKSGQVSDAAPAKSFRIGIFNIDGGYGTDGKRDLNRTAKTLEGCDLVGLNEVHAGLPWQQENQAQKLGMILQMPWLFAPTERRWWQDDFGNGILSKLPVAHWQRFPLSTQVAGSNRNIVLVKVKFRDRFINVLVTHLDRHEDHDIELRSVAELFLSLAEPAILMGDLNDSASHPEIHRLQTTMGVTDITGLVQKEHRDSDWIFSRGLVCVGAGLKDEGASDHPFYWADLDLLP